MKTFKKNFKSNSPLVIGDNKIFSKKLNTKIKKIIKFINLKPKEFNLKSKVMLSNEAINMMCDEIIYTIIDAQRDGIEVGDTNSKKLSNDLIEDYEKRLINLARLIHSYQTAVKILYGDIGVSKLDAYLSSKEILLRGEESSSVSYHLEVIRNYIELIPEGDHDSYSWALLAIEKGEEILRKLECDA